MKCKCGNEKLVSIHAHCQDRCSVDYGDKTISEADYAPRIDGICGGDYIKFTFCPECGTIQADFPKDMREFLPEEDEDGEM